MVVVVVVDDVVGVSDASGEVDVVVVVVDVVVVVSVPGAGGKPWDSTT